MRKTAAALMLTGVLACSSGSTETVPVAPMPDAFAGAWQATTPSLNFVRLSISSLSSEHGAFGARLTLSGVAWEGRGRIDGDSLVVPVAVSGSTEARGMLVVHVREGQTLAARLQSGSAATPLELTLVRER
jgi:hypothetical protein